MQNTGGSESQTELLNRCAECGAELPGSSGRQLCPRCLLRLGLGEVSKDLDSGDQIDHYQILEILGAGGMGLVYVAQDLKLKRRVALKVLSEATTKDPASLTRFRREAQSLAALQHPNVVTVFAVEESEDRHYIVMELVDGVTLSKIVAPSGLHKERFFELACGLTGAVAAAHEQGIIHRDLKPTNVMLTRKGEVKVLDFGLAKFWHPSSDQISTGAATEQGLIVGTVPYMSPEQLQGGELDARSDVFSLGIVLYEMATGRHPFECETTAETISAILRDEPAPLREVQKDLPAELQAIVGRCLEKEPGDRYSSAVELTTDLAWLREHITHESDTWGAPKWTRMLEWNRIWPLAVAALFIGLIAAVLLQPFSRHDSSEPIAVESPEKGDTEEASSPEDSTIQTSPGAPAEVETESGPSAGPGAESNGKGSHAETVEPSVDQTTGAGKSAVAESQADQYSVHASLFLQGDSGPRRLASGSRVAPGDQLYLSLESTEELHVYVLNEDDLGEVFVLFPVQGVDLGNPLAAGAVHRLPGAHEGTPLNWQVSSAGGEDHILIIASTGPVAEIERLFADLPQAAMDRVEYIRVPDTVVAELRGIGQLVEAESPRTPVPAGRLFSHAQHIATEPETMQGLWIRRIDLRNPVQGSER